MSQGICRVAAQTGSYNPIHTAHCEHLEGAHVHYLLGARPYPHLMAGWSLSNGQTALRKKLSQRRHGPSRYHCDFLCVTLLKMNGKIIMTAKRESDCYQFKISTILG